MHFSLDVVKTNYAFRHYTINIGIMFTVYNFVGGKTRHCLREFLSYEKTFPKISFLTTFKLKFSFGSRYLYIFLIVDSVWTVAGLKK